MLCTYCTSGCRVAQYHIVESEENFSEATLTDIASSNITTANSVNPRLNMSIADQNVNLQLVFIVQSSIIPTQRSNEGLNLTLLAGWIMSLIGRSKNKNRNEMAVLLYGCMCKEKGNKDSLGTSGLRLMDKRIDNFE